MADCPNASAADDDEATAMLTIDQLAQRVGMSVRNLREWRALGLLPAPTMRGRTGYYDERTVQRVQSIQQLHAEGFTLDLIRRLLDATEGFGPDAMQFAAYLREPFRERERPVVSREELADRWGPVDDRQLARALELGVLAERDDGNLEFASARLDRVGQAMAGLGMSVDQLLEATALIRSRLDDITQLFEDVWLEHVWEPFVEAGMPEDEQVEIQATVAELQTLAHDAVLGWFRVAMDEQIARGVEREAARVLDLGVDEDR